MFQEYNIGFLIISGGIYKLVIVWGGIYNFFLVDVFDNGIFGVVKEWFKVNFKFMGVRLL